MSIKQLILITVLATLGLGGLILSFGVELVTSYVNLFNF